jgi:type I restriction-modification system DNA methylase subunit
MYSKKIIKLFEKFRYKYDMSSVFYDFLVIASVSLSNQVDFIHSEEREKYFYEVQSKYSKEDFYTFVEILAELAKGLNAKKTDLLGEVYMQMDLGKKCGGQFFTPYSISQMMAKMTVDKDGMSKLINKKGYITMNEPCSGGGGMCIAFAEAMEEAGFDCQKHLLITAQDIDRTCVMMTYIQLSLLGIPAYVILGNSLLVECKDIWYTPAFMINGWPKKLYKKKEDKESVAS